MDFFFSVSFGSIHPAIKKLEKNKLVFVRKSIENGRVKKYYRLSDLGKKELFHWLNGDIVIDRIQDEGLLKIYFLTNIPVENRIKAMEQYVAICTRQFDQLRAIKESTDISEIPVEYKEIAQYQLETLDFGYSYYQFVINWYENFISRMKQRTRK
jgi:DNA-binding PadR family transcriptional regulator